MIDLRRSLMLAALAGATLFAAPAQACRGPMLEYRFLHKSLPELDKGDVAARVEIVKSNWPTPGQDGFEAEARIIEVLHGTFPGSRVTIGPGIIMSSCDRGHRKGEKGILVGKIVSVGRNVVTLLPTRTKTDYQLYLEAEKVGGAK